MTDTVMNALKKQIDFLECIRSMFLVFLIMISFIVGFVLHIIRTTLNMDGAVIFLLATIFILFGGLLANNIFDMLQERIDSLRILYKTS